MSRATFIGTAAAAAAEIVGERILKERFFKKEEEKLSDSFMPARAVQVRNNLVL